MFDREIQIRRGSYLPHWTKEGAMYHVRIRLADSLSQEKLEEWKGERKNEIASIVAGTLRFFDEDRYKLLGWCIMPNHIHVVLQPLTHELSDILNSWKKFTAREANKLLGRRGESFWQREYFDHLI